MTWDDYTFTEISISTVVAPFNINIIILYIFIHHIMVAQQKKYNKKIEQLN